jgi:hypothetical protein
MNEMELLRQMGEETPLPAPAELDAARARLVAAITTEPATHAPAVPEVVTPQPAPSTSQSIEPLRPPAPVLTAARFMHAGAIGTAAGLIILLAFSGDINLYHLTLFGHHYTAAQLRHLRPLLLTAAVAAGLALIAVWLWMARATSQGKNWARITATVLFALATLQLVGNHGVVQVFYAALTWLTGLPAVWLLWRPASSAFFESAKALRSQSASGNSGP